MGVKPREVQGATGVCDYLFCYFHGNHNTPLSNYQAFIIGIAILTGFLN